MIRSSLLPVLALAALVFAGCPSATNLTSARTLDKGSLEITIAPTVTGGFGVSNPDGGTAVAVGGIPSAEGQLRYGISDHVEVGAKLWLGGFATHFKFGLLRSETAEDGFNLSFDPGVSYAGIGAGTNGAYLLHFYLPVLAGYRFGGHEITVGPRLVPTVVGVSVGGGSASEVAFMGGASFAISLRLGEAFRLTPELSVLAPLSQDPAEGVGGLTQLSLGFSFGT